MSLVKDGRITVRKFAAVPALLDLDEIHREPASVSNVSSFRGASGRVDLAEGCMLTKSVKYTHQLAHWVNAVRGHDKDSDPTEVQNVINDLNILPYENFSVNHSCNFAYLEAFVHTSLDLYAFIAVTASSSTLDSLIEMVKSENESQQQDIDEGFIVSRKLNFGNQDIVNPKYELVAIHPEHFLPDGSVLTIYNRATATHKNYVPAPDRRLRESVHLNSPCLQAFYHPRDDNNERTRLNVFLVILNAQIKFHRYFQMIHINPPAIPLPQDILTLMHRTNELVELLYWKPKPTKGSKGEMIIADEIASSKHRKKFHWPEGMDLQARMAYGRAVMSGHDRDYDPALFEGAFPINYTSNLYSKRSAVETWREGALKFEDKHTAEKP